LFLASIFTDPNQNIDHRLAATTALRKSEDVRIMPAIERPSPPTPDVDPEKAKAKRKATHLVPQEKHGEQAHHGPG
jgi:hypothetical protein